MTFKKSMISIAAAAVITTGFTGCNGGDEAGASDTWSAVVNPNEQASYTAVINGLVIDDMGKFVEGAKVSVDGQTTTTDGQGQYHFESINISSYVTNEVGKNGTAGVNVNAENLLNISISAPADSDMNNAVVQVSPEMIHIENNGDDQASAVATTEGDQNVLANSQSFTISSQAGTAVLAHKAADVTFDVRLDTGVPVPDGTKVIAVYTGLSKTGVINPAAINNYIMSVNSVSATTKDGNVVFNDILTSAEYSILVEGYNTNNQILSSDLSTPKDNDDADTTLITNSYNGYADSNYTVNLGNLMVTPITSVDEISPRVASVANTFGILGARLMLDETVTNTITVNFTEAIKANDIVNNVKVITTDDAGIQSYLDIANAEISGSQLKVTLANDITSGQKLDLYVFRNTDLTDLSDNALVFNGVADDETTTNFPILSLANCTTGCSDEKLDYLSCTTGSRAIKFELMGYKELNMNAEGATDLAQKQLNDDAIRTTSSSLTDIETYSNAFNDLTKEDISNVVKASVISQLNNVSDADKIGSNDKTTGNVEERLQLLAVALGDTTVSEVNANTAMVSFVANNASSYLVTVPDGSTCTAGNTNITVTSPTCNVTTGPKGTSVTVTASAGTTVDLLISDIKHGAKVVITPVDDMCVPGSASDVTVYDNVAPTTILQNSYMDSACVTSDTVAWNTFGDGGELSNGSSDGTSIGMPILSLTPGLFDNLDSTGNNILDANQYVTADETLVAELINHNKVYDHNDDNIADETINDVIADSATTLYDATAYAVFAANQARTVGIAMSESVQNIPTTAAYNGTTAITDFTVLNDVIDTDSKTNDNTGLTGDIQDGKNVEKDENGNPTTITQADLVTFKTADVMAMANSITNSSAPTINLTGIEDLAGNKASNAQVAVYDRMPPMVKRAYKLNGIVTIEFNEDIKLQTVASTVGSSIVVDGQTYKYDENANPQTWSVTGNVLTIGTTTNSSGITLNSNTNTTYAESIYDDVPGMSGSEKYPHASLNINNISDKNGNTWELWNTKTDCYGDTDNESYEDMPEPTFAMVNVKTAFKITTNNTDFTYPANFEDGVTSKNQKLVWNFTHALDTQATFGTDEDTEIPMPNKILDNFQYVPQTGVPTLLSDNSGSLKSSFGISNLNAILDSSRTQLTITFEQSNNSNSISISDIIRYTNEDSNGKEIGGDGKDVNNNKVQSDEDDNAQNATSQGYDQGK